jgi:hypothetical protein
MPIQDHNRIDNRFTIWALTTQPVPAFDRSAVRAGRFGFGGAGLSLPLHNAVAFGLPTFCGGTRLFAGARVADGMLFLRCLAPLRISLVTDAPLRALNLPPTLAEGCRQPFRKASRKAFRRLR